MRLVSCVRCGARWSGLKVEHCVAPGCCLTFSSTPVGDAHRVGVHGVKEGPDRRRCLSSEEMAALTDKHGELRFAVRVNRYGTPVWGRPPRDMPSEVSREGVEPRSGHVGYPATPPGCSGRSDRRGRVTRLGSATVLQGDALSLPLPDASVDLVVTSPPYFGLRSYTDGGEHYAGQLGDEATPREYVANLVAATREMVRVLKPSGSIFVNLGDKYGGDPTPGGVESSGLAKQRGGSNPQVTAPRQRGRSTGRVKSLHLIPERFRIAAVDMLGLTCRAVVVWSKPNGLPESVTDRVRRSHEDWVHLTAGPRYFSAVDEIREEHVDRRPSRDGRDNAVGPRGALGVRCNEGTHEQIRNPLGKLPGSVWTIPTQPLRLPAWLGVDHFAAFPMEWPRRLIRGWSPVGVCVACGEGRRPVWARPDGNAPDDVRRLYDRKASFHATYKGLWGQAHQDWLDANPKRRLGYVCGCPDTAAPTRPSVILDPFGGTGTTATVAKALGQHGVTVDKSADYCRVARWRTSDPDQLAQAAEVAKPPPVVDGQVGLFDLDPAS